jgi:hypothetical protein
MQDQELCTTSRAGQGTAMSDAIQRDVWAISTKLSARDRYQPVTRREWKDTGGSQPAALVPLAPVPPSVNRARRSLCMWSPNSKQQDGTGILLGPGQILSSRCLPRLPTPPFLWSCAHSHPLLVLPSTHSPQLWDNFGSRNWALGKSASALSAERNDDDATLASSRNIRIPGVRIRSVVRNTHGDITWRSEA